MNHAPPIDFTIELVLFQPPRYGQPLNSVPPKECIKAKTIGIGWGVGATSLERLQPPAC